MATATIPSRPPAAVPVFADPSPPPSVIYDRQWPLVAGSSLSPHPSSHWSPIHDHIACHMLPSLIIHSAASYYADGDDTIDVGEDGSGNQTMIEYTALSGTVIRRWPGPPCTIMDNQPWIEQAMEWFSWSRLPSLPGKPAAPLDNGRDRNAKEIVITVAERCACAMGCSTKEFIRAATEMASPIVPFLDHYVVQCALLEGNILVMTHQAEYRSGVLKRSFDMLCWSPRVLTPITPRSSSGPPPSSPADASSSSMSMGTFLWNDVQLASVVEVAIGRNLLKLRCYHPGVPSGVMIPSLLYRITDCTIVTLVTTLPGERGLYSARSKTVASPPPSSSLSSTTTTGETKRSGTKKEKEKERDDLAEDADGVMYHPLVTWRSMEISSDGTLLTCTTNSTPTYFLVYSLATIMNAPAIELPDGGGTDTTPITTMYSDNHTSPDGFYNLHPQVKRRRTLPVVPLRCVLLHAWNAPLPRNLDGDLILPTYTKYQEYEMWGTTLRHPRYFMRYHGAPHHKTFILDTFTGECVKKWDGLPTVHPPKSRDAFLINTFDGRLELWSLPSSSTASSSSPSVLRFIQSWKFIAHKDKKKTTGDGKDDGSDGNSNTNDDGTAGSYTQAHWLNASHIAISTPSHLMIYDLSPWLINPDLTAITTTMNATNSSSDTATSTATATITTTTSDTTPPPPPATATPTPPTTTMVVDERERHDDGLPPLVYMKEVWGHSSIAPLPKQWCKAATEHIITALYHHTAGKSSPVVASSSASSSSSTSLSLLPLPIALIVVIYYLGPTYTDLHAPIND